MENFDFAGGNSLMVQEGQQADYLRQWQEYHCACGRILYPGQIQQGSVPLIIREAGLTEAQRAMMKFLRLSASQDWQDVGKNMDFVLSNLGAKDLIYLQIYFGQGRFQ